MAQARRRLMTDTPRCNVSPDAGWQEGSLGVRGPRASILTRPRESGKAGSSRVCSQSKGMNAGNTARLVLTVLGASVGQQFGVYPVDCLADRPHHSDMPTPMCKPSAAVVARID